MLRSKPERRKSRANLSGMRSWMVFPVSLALIMVLAGCGKKNSEKILGLWRTTDKQGEVYGFIEIAKDKLLFDGGDQSLDVAMEDKDDKVTLRRAGTEEIIAVVTVVDDNNIEMAFSSLLGGSLKLVRSSKEEMTAILNPPVDKIVGFWRSEDEGVAPGIHTTLEIAPDRIVRDDESTQVAIETRKGAYIITQGGAPLGTMMLQDDGTLQYVTGIGGFGGFDTFVRSSGEENQKISEAKRELVQGHFGFWKAEKSDFSGKYAYIEIGDDFVDDNGDRSSIHTAWNSRGLGLVRDGDNGPFLTVRLTDDDHLEVSKGGPSSFSFAPDTTYERSDRDELEKFSSPQLGHYLGFWLLDEPGDESFRAVEIGADYVIRDRRKEPMAVSLAADGSIHMIRPEPRKMDLMVMTRVDDDHVTLGYGDYDKTSFPYRRAAKEEYESVTAGIINPLSYVTGFWRSEEPVKDSLGESVVHATVALALNVLGSEDKAVDWSSESFIQPELRNRSLGAGDRVREGIFVFNRGKVGEPMELVRIDGNNGSWMQVRVVNENTLEIATNHKNYVRCVRTTKEEMMQYRAQVKR